MAIWPAFFTTTTVVIPNAPGSWSSWNAWRSSS